MSRTYRIDKSHYNRWSSSRKLKYIDCHPANHLRQVIEDVTYIIAHDIWNMPCKHIGKPLVTVEYNVHYPGDTIIDSVDHATCIEFGEPTVPILYMPRRYRRRCYSWYSTPIQATIKLLYGNRGPYKVLNKSSFKPFSGKRPAHHSWKRHKNRGLKRKDRVSICDALKSGDYDEVSSKCSRAPRR